MLMCQRFYHWSALVHVLTGLFPDSDLDSGEEINIEYTSARVGPKTANVANDDDDFDFYD
jgi:hypothetical protein